MPSIHFTDPTRMLPGERCSKLLAVPSQLVDELGVLRTALKTAFADEVSDPRPWHIELHPYSARPDETRVEEELRAKVVNRAQELEGKDVLINSDTLQTLGKAIILETPAVEGYGVTHITISFFIRGIPAGALGVARSFVA